MGRAEDVGAFRHEMHAAEDDELGVRMLADLARKLERVACVVGELDDLVALVVMAQDDQAAPSFLRASAIRRSISSSERPRYSSGAAVSPARALSRRRSGRDEFSHLVI